MHVEYFRKLIQLMFVQNFLLININESICMLVPSPQQCVSQINLCHSCQTAIPVSFGTTSTFLKLSFTVN